MIIDNITIIIGAVLVVLALVTPLLNGFFRKPSVNEGLSQTPSDDETKTADNNCSPQAPQPKVSILLTPHDNVQELERNLPAYLEQDYAAGYEVIVVTWQGDQESEELLKRYKDNPLLYCTYIPDSSRYMSREKLAVTIGVKAAKNEWVLMADIHTRPDSNQWLKTLARNCTEFKNLVIGYVRFNEETGAYKRFETFLRDCYLMSEAQKGHPFRCGNHCLMFRKSEFMAADGFKGNLKYLQGEYDFMVNKYAREGSVALENAPEAWMTADTPTDKTWKDFHLFYLEHRKHLNGGTGHCLKYAFDQIAMHVNYLLEIATIVFATLTQRWLLTGIATIALTITVVLRIVIARKAFKRFDVNISRWAIVPFELGLCWHALFHRISYWRADKTEFISHKL